MKKKVLIGLVALRLALALSACGISMLPETGDGPVASTGGTPDVSASSDEGAKESEEEQEQKPQPQFPSVNFNEEFTLAAGETVQLEGDVIFTVEAVEYIETTDLMRCAYVVEVNNVKYDEVFFWQPGADKPDNIYNGNDNPYQVDLLNLDLDNEKGTFRILAPLPTPDPMVVSGNAEDVYTTEDYEYLVGKNCILFLDKDMTIRGNVMEDLDKVIAALEKESGMSFYPDKEYCEQSEGGARKIYYGLDPWPGVNEDHSIPCVYAVVDRDNKMLSSVCLGKAVVVVDYDFNIDEKGVYVFAHEFAHAIQETNSVPLESKMAEGFGVYMGLRVARSLDGYAISNYMEDGYYSYFPEKIDATTAEELFLREFRDYAMQESNYEFGYALVTYLFETYGDNAYKEFLEEVSKRMLKGVEYSDMPYMYQADPETEAAVLKDLFSENFFEDFGKWYVKNKNRL